MRAELKSKQRLLNISYAKNSWIHYIKTNTEDLETRNKHKCDELQEK